MITHNPKRDMIGGRLSVTMFNFRAIAAMWPLHLSRAQWDFNYIAEKKALEKEWGNIKIAGCAAIGQKEEREFFKPIKAMEN